MAAGRAGFNPQRPALLPRVAWSRSTAPSGSPRRMTCRDLDLEQCARAGPCEKLRRMLVPGDAEPTGSDPAPKNHQFRHAHAFHGFPDRRAPADRSDKRSTAQSRQDRSCYKLKRRDSLDAPASPRCCCGLGWAACPVWRSRGRLHVAPETRPGRGWAQRTGSVPWRWPCRRQRSVRLD
jgi:hypothetical protein